MTTPYADDGQKRQEILSRVDADGKQIYGQPRRDPATGQWYARRNDDHAKWDRV